MAEQNTNVTNTSEQQELGELLQIRRDKLKALQDEGRDPFQITKFDVTHHAQDIKDNFDALEGTPVRVAGRLMSKRGMGKVSFCDMQDKSGRIQIYARKDEMDEDNYDRFKKYDIEKQELPEVENYLTEDADIIVTGYGASARIVRSAVNAARAEGIKAGMIRPITLWPFPEKAYADTVETAKAYLVVELSMGQMVDDVRLATSCRRPVRFFGRTGGVIHTPAEILAQIKLIAKEELK